MDSTAIMENRPGRVVLNRYELGEQIGRGGFSTVYRAYDRKMGREVALKAVARTEELTSRASREAKAAAKLSHPHIVTVFELAQDDHEVYIVSELVKGRTLGLCLLENSLSDRECAEIMLQVLMALGHAHDQGVIHRDIKPDNIMIVDDGGPPRAKVMDFGIAQLENTQRLTRRGDVLGTVSYMSPEQANAQPVGGATDVYSAALTLYECLAGANPFRAATAAETIARIQAGAPPLAEARPDLPAELSHLLEEAMEPDPGLRLDLRGFAAGLKRAMEELPEEDDGQATTVLKRAQTPRPSIFRRAAGRFGFIAARMANGGLAALVALAAVYGSGLYPDPWRPALVAGAAFLVALLPRAGLVGLAALALLPVGNYSVALAAVLAALAAAYLLSFGMIWPRLALLPVLAVGLGLAGIGLAYPVVSGSIGRWRGLALALAGGAAFTLFQLLSGAPAIDYLGIPNSYSLSDSLTGQYNPVTALTALAEPFRQHTVLLAQPAIWLAAALPAALLIRRRGLIMDISGLAAANILLAAGYLGLPRVFPGYALNQAAFLKTFALCVIIQFGVLLISSRIKSKSRSLSQRVPSKSISPRERTQET